MDANFRHRPSLQSSAVRKPLLSRLSVGIALGIIVLCAGAFVWLATTPMMPPVHTVEQSIADDRIPH